MSIKYDDYITEHKSNVMKAFEWLDALLPTTILSEEVRDQIKIEGSFVDHDKSKWGTEEYEAYDKYFYGSRSYGVVNDFDYAWLHHIHNNPHHWQYWVLLNDDPQLGEKLLEIPDKYIFEMICDWWSFSWKSGNLYEIFNWYEDRKLYMKINEVSRLKITTILETMRILLKEQEAGE